jgi:hypothetical protein
MSTWIQQGTRRRSGNAAVPTEDDPAMSSVDQIRRSLSALKEETEAQKRRRAHQAAGGDRSLLEVLAFTAPPSTPSPLATVSWPAGITLARHLGQK